MQRAAFPALRRCGAALFVAMTWTASAAAQTSTGPLDANALPAPLAPTAFSALEASEESAPGSFAAFARLSHLARPLALRLPSPSPGGTSTSAVEGILLLEVGASFGLGAGFDVAVGAGLHAYQWGGGTSAVTGGERLAPVAGSDPRVGVGYAVELGPVHLRPYGTLFIPLGDDRQFAGEGFVRGEFGASSSIELNRVTLGLDVALRLRRDTEIGLATIGPTLRVGAGALVEVVEHFSLGAEVILLPTFAAQTAPSGGEAGALFPAEARGLARFELDDWALLASVGTGLGLSRASSLDADGGLERAPTSPALRSLVEARLSFE